MYGDDKESTTEDDAAAVIVDNATVVKGEKQPNSFRDPFFAALYIVHLICLFSVAVALGIPSLKGSIDASSSSSSGTGGEINVTGLVLTTVSASFVSFLLSMISLAFMMKFAKSVIKISLLFSVAVSLLMAIIAAATGNVAGAIMGFLFFGLSACYAFCVWSRIPFAAANLNTGLSAVRVNFGLTLVAFFVTAMSIVYNILWTVALAGTYTSDVTCDPQGVCTGNPNGGVVFLLLVSFYWAQQVTKNVIHVTVAGTVGTWWFAPEEASSCCSQGVKESFCRASTYSFGSICFGSLLVAIIRALRALVEQARQSDDANPILLCLVDCILSCLESLLEYFNKWAFIYVGLYGYTYMEAGKNVMTLFQARGFTTVITDDLVSNALSFMCLVMGLLSGTFGLIPAAANKEMFSGIPEDSIMYVGFFIGFIVGIVISSIMFAVVESSVNTVIVCYAEAPAEFQNNHPDLSMEMREAWRSAYPELQGL